MLDKIVKNNKVMGIVSLATLAIVAIVLVYRPWKAQRDSQINTGGGGTDE